MTHHMETDRKKEKKDGEINTHFTMKELGFNIKYNLYYI